MSDPLSKVPPQNLQAEIAVIGSILLDPEAADKVTDKLEPGDFYKEAHGIVYRTIIELYNRSEPTDIVTVTNALESKGLLEKVGGADYLSTLIDSVPTTVNVDSYAEIVAEKSLLRSLIKAGNKIVSMGFDESKPTESALQDSERLIFDIAQRKIRSDFHRLKNLIKETFDKIDKWYHEKGSVTGVATGFDDLDVLTSGLQPSDMVVLAARPSMGKTALALTLAANVAARGEPVALFSLEMSAEQLALRMLCSEAKVDSHRLRTGYLSDKDWKKLLKGMDTLTKAALFIDDTPGITPTYIRNKAKRLLKEQGELSLIVVDYLQLMSLSNAESRVQEISQISRELKAVGRDLGVPVLVLSQLSRAVEQRTDRRPMLSDLRESGAIEQDADLVMFIYRKEYYAAYKDGDSFDNEDNGQKYRSQRDKMEKSRRDEELGGAVIDEKTKSEIIIAKHRNGPTGTINLHFNSRFARFENIDHSSPAPPP